MKVRFHLYNKITRRHKTLVELGFSDNDLDEKFHNMTELAMEVR